MVNVMNNCFDDTDNIDEDELDRLLEDIEMFLMPDNDNFLENIPEESIAAEIPFYGVVWKYFDSMKDSKSLPLSCPDKLQADLQDKGFFTRDELYIVAGYNPDKTAADYELYNVPAGSAIDFVISHFHGVSNFTVNIFNVFPEYGYVSTEVYSREIKGCEYYELIPLSRADVYLNDINKKCNLLNYLRENEYFYNKICIFSPYIKFLYQDLFGGINYGAT